MAQYETLYLYVSQINSVAVPSIAARYNSKKNDMYRYTTTVLKSWMEHYFSILFFEDDCSKPKLKASLIVMHDGLCGLLLFLLGMYVAHDIKNKPSLQNLFFLLYTDY